MSFQDNLKKFREKTGLSAKEFSKKNNITYTTYMNYENKGSWPNEETLTNIASGLGISIDELLGFKINEFTECINTVRQTGLFELEVDDKYVAVHISNNCGSYTYFTAINDRDDIIRIYTRDDFISLVKKIKHDFYKSISIQEQWGNSLYMQFLADLVQDLYNDKFKNDQKEHKLSPETQKEINRLINKAKLQIHNKNNNDN